MIGDLVLPATSGPHPVLLVVDGGAGTGGPGESSSRTVWRDELAQAGIASFGWGRPSGGTGGSAHSDVRLRAREVLAAWEKLVCVPEVDGAAVALAGWDDGGWVAAQAATFAGRARALILLSTPMVSAATLAEHRFVGRLRRAGFAADDVSDARETLRRRWYRRADGDSLASILSDDQEFQARAWYPLLPDARQLGEAATMLDPRPTLSGVTVPVLAMYGEQDSLVPLEDCVRGVRSALRSAGHRDHRVAVVRGADHGLRVRPGHGLGALVDGFHRFGDWPVGLTDFVASWLDSRIRHTASVPSYVPPLPAAVPGVSGRTGQPSTTPWSDAARPDGEHGGLPVRQVRRRIAR